MLETATIRRAGLCAALWLGCSLPGAGPAMAAQDAAQDVFQRFSRWVVQIQLVDASSGSKGGIGSGFVVSRSGLVVTNYHVVAERLHHPKRYRLEMLDSQGVTGPVELLAFDVHHDLAIVRREQPFDGQFGFAEPELEKGMRLYSLGNPYDIGLSIVEGTYNGLLEFSRYKRIHFSGSLNPGMSGGPAVLEDGSVVGVNVATAGNDLSFLVPAAPVRALVQQVSDPEFAPSPEFTTELRAQLLAYQQDYVDDLMARPVETVQLGSYLAASRPAPYFNCWGGSYRDDDGLFETSTHQCLSQDGVYVSDDHDFSLVRFWHHQLETRALSASRFYRLYSDRFEANHSRLWGHDRDVTGFRCRTRFVDHADLTFKTVFCARRYKKLDGLYDVIFKAAAVGDVAEGFQTALVLSSVSFESAIRLARRHLESIGPAP